MAASKFVFKRAVLGVFHSVEPPAVRVAGELAERLDLQIVGLFALDRAIQTLAGYSKAREFLPSKREWRFLDPDIVAREQMLAAEAARRAFKRLVQSHRVPSSFEIVTAAAGQIFETVEASDILVLPLPRRASAAALYSLTVFVESAVRSAASVLFVPQTAQARKGPIVVIARSPDDPSIAVAIRVAAAAQEKVILVTGFDEALEAPLKDETGAVIEQIRGSEKALYDVQYVSELLGNRTESLIILMRSDGAAIPGDYCADLAERRKAPVLLLEPMNSDVRIRQV
jgi:hypothetical protein